MYKTKLTAILALMIALTVSALTAAGASAATLDGPWSATGTGSTTATSDGTSSDPVLDYSVAGFSGNWTFSTTAKSAREQTANWHYKGYHAWFQVRVGLEKFVIRAGKEIVTEKLIAAGPVNCCAAPSGGFDYTGTTKFALQAGDVYGFRMSGSHFDSDRRLLGKLSLTLPVPAASSFPTPTTVAELDALLKTLQTQSNAFDAEIKAAQTQMMATNAELKQLQTDLAAAQAAGDTAKATQLKAQIDELTTKSQLDMIRLQSLVNKRNQALEQVTNLLSKYATLKDAIIHNMR